MGGTRAMGIRYKDTPEKEYGGIFMPGRGSVFFAQAEEYA